MMCTLAHTNVPCTRVERKVACATPLIKTHPRAHESATDTLLRRIHVLYPHIQDTPRAHQCALHTRRMQGRVRVPSRVRVKKNGWYEGGGVEGAHLTLQKYNAEHFYTLFEKVSAKKSASHKHHSSFFKIFKYGVPQTGCFVGNYICFSRILPAVCRIDS